MNVCLVAGVPGINDIQHHPVSDALEAGRSDSPCNYTVSPDASQQLESSKPSEPYKPATIRRRTDRL